MVRPLAGQRPAEVPAIATLDESEEYQTFRFLAHYFFGNTLNSNSHPSPRAKQAKMRNGAVFPTNWYMTPPKGGPVRTEQSVNI